MLAALGRTAWLALRQPKHATGAAPATPGPLIEITRPPLPRDLIDDYLRHLGAEPRSYRGEVPPHFFPQFCFPALARTLESLPYPLMKVVNGGCRVEVLAPLPDNEPIHVSAQLEAIEDDGSRAILKQRVIAGTASTPQALRIEFTAIVPLGSGTKDKSEKSDKAAVKPAVKKDRPRVPDGVHEIAREHLRADAGLSFAKLTGDFNPIHWVPPYAKASGFNNVILHGFGTFARAWEGVVQHVLGGDVHAIETIEARLTRPLVLPHEIGIYVHGSELFVGDAPGGPAYLMGRFTTRSTFAS